MRILPFLAVWLIGTTAVAQVSVIHDLPTTVPLLVDAGPDELVVVGDVILFVASDPVNGRELWRTDGTEAGTFLVRDISPSDSDPRNLTVVGTNVYFTANDGLHGRELWKSDGTTLGTALVSDILPGPASSTPHALVGVASTLYFGADGPSGGDLWATDGTAVGTAAIAGPSGLGGGSTVDVRPGNGLVYVIRDGVPYIVGPASLDAIALGGGVSIGDCSVLGSRLVFGMVVSGDAELYASDAGGPAARVADLNPGGSSSPNALVTIDGAVYFRATGPGGVQYYVWDGTAAPAAITAFAPDDIVLPGISGVSGHLYFYASDGGPYRFFMSAGDPGAPGQTVLSPNLNIARPDAHHFGALGLAQGDSGLGYGLLGTLGATGVSGFRDYGIRSANRDITHFGAFAGRYYLRADDFLFSLGDALESPTVSYGTTSYTRPVAALPSGDVVFSSSGGGASERQLYAGATSPTLVKAIGRRATSSNPRMFSPLASDAFWLTSTGLYRASTRDVLPPLVAAGETIGALKTMGDKLFVSVSSDQQGTFVRDPAWAPTGAFFSDLSIDSSAGHSAEFDGKAWFVSGSVLSSYDAGSVSTHPSINAYPDQLTPCGGRMFLLQDIESSGELWQLAPGGVSTQLRASGAGSSIVCAGDKLFFVQDTTALWVVPAQSTPALVSDFSASGCTVSSLGLRAAGDHVFFALACADGLTLWSSSGTAQSTQSLGVSPIRYVGSLGTSFYFSSADALHGVELWLSDGTPAGTKLVLDIATGAASSDPQEGAAATSGTLWFTATDGVHGFELWRTDGTSSGTTLVQDLEPGPGSSFPRGMTAAQGLILFSAMTTAEGEEAWHTGALADFSLTADASVSAPALAVPFSLTAHVTNTGSAGVGATLDVDIPTGLTVTAVSGATCGALPATAAALRCALAAAGDVVFTATASQVGPLSSLLTLTPLGVDFTASALTANVAVNAVGVDLALTASVAPVTVKVGERATMTASLVNQGTADASNVRLVFSASGAATLSDAQIPGIAGASCQVVGSDLSCAVGLLASGAQVSATVTLVPTAPGTLQATVTAQASELDADASNDSASVSVSAIASDSPAVDTPTVDTPSSEPNARKGCACHASGPSSAIAWLLGMLMLSWRLWRTRSVRSPKGFAR